MTAPYHNLQRHVETLAGEIGERHVGRPRAYARAADYIRDFWQDLGYEVRTEIHVVDGVPCRTLEAGRGDVVVGAHYDTVPLCPGANDNGSGVAAMLEISRTVRDARYVAFANEEPPHFRTDDMGSRIYTLRAKERGEKFRAMLSLETLGCYSDDPGSQQYPPLAGWFRPDRGNFLGVVGDRSSSKLVDRVVELFRAAADFPVESIATFRWVPGVDWSDHASFWDQGWPAVMITDTAPYRYPHYHLPSDTPDKIDYPCFGRVVEGLRAVVAGMMRP